jgi:hypothetical protein
VPQHSFGARIVSLLLLAACARPSSDTGTSASASAATPPVIVTPSSRTNPAITEGDLRTRVYIFADDSMMGRDAPLEGDRMAADYLASELRRLGLEPAGDNGTYFQDLPNVERGIDAGATLQVDGVALRYGSDFLPTSLTTPRPVSGVQVVYGGVAGADTTSQITAAAAAGKFVVLGAPATGGARTRILRSVPHFSTAAGIAIVNLDLIPQPNREELASPILMNGVSPSAPVPEGPIALAITPAAAERLLGGPVVGRALGATGRTVSGDFRLNNRPLSKGTARNVVAILRGSDPALRGQFVAIGAHKDHVGYNHHPIDHDSARAVYLAENRAQMEGRSATASELTVNMDSLRRIRPARRDSIYNGADDDGSGSMAVLEIAEALANAPTKPARSVLFVWHTGEEDGLLGSAYYTTHPTVPRDSIIAQINIDMIGRGTAQDVKGGGPDYLIVVGHRRMSRDLGDVIEAVNARQPRPFHFDLAWDAPNHPEQIYGRSDHANYARVGIPVAFFFTGLHADYHQITDEPQYIDYPHYTRIVQYLNDVVVELGNRRERVKVDRR